MSGPGQSQRNGITIFELHRMFPDDETAERWFIEQRWPDGVHCPDCGSLNIQHRQTRKPQPYRCRDCRKDFSVKTDTLMHNSKLSFQTWAFAIYMMSTSLKGQASMKLHRELGMTQKSAWHLAHRIREAFDDDTNPFSGPVEVDETFMGGKRQNMPLSKRKKMTGRGTVGKSVVVGAKDRKTRRVKARVVENTDKATLQDFIAEAAEPGAQVYTDDHASYEGLPFPHEVVKHSVAEYVREQVHTNGMESFWSMLKRGHTGTYHKMSKKHLHRYVREFEGRQNVRHDDTATQMEQLAKGMDGKRLSYAKLKS